MNVYMTRYTILWTVRCFLSKGRQFINIVLYILLLKCIFPESLMNIFLVIDIEHIGYNSMINIYVIPFAIYTFFESVLKDCPDDPVIFSLH